MSSVIDLWRAVDPDARLRSGAGGELRQPVRSVARTRSAAPLLPAALDAGLLVADGSLVGSIDDLLAALVAAELAPAAIVVTGPAGGPPDSVTTSIPVFTSDQPAAQLVERATTYLADEASWLARLAIELRLACAEAALAEPDVATPAGLIAARIRRGVAVTGDGALLSLHPRDAGRALAARFAATHARLLAGAAQQGDGARRTRDGLWLLERRVRPGASLWLFDDLPFAAVDEVAAEAAATTLRALLRRPAPSAARATPVAAGGAPHDPGAGLQPAPRAGRPAPADPLAATLLAVARHNGRVAPAARELGVHRNTVLYRLRQAAHERGVDPRRPEDALRILAEAASDG